MTTMLDCIRQSAVTGKVILDNARKNTDALVELVKDVKKLEGIEIVGSGSSYNASFTEVAFMEKVTGLPVHAYHPNAFARKTVYNPKALYIFVSQSGTSTLVKKQIIKVNELGCCTVAVTDDRNSPIATTCKLNVPIEVNGEPFGYRTVGFCSTFMTLKVIALRIGLENGYLTEEQYNAYLADGYKAIENHPAVVEAGLKWFEANKDVMKGLRSVMYYGGGELHGIAIEGALKLLETPKIYLSFGWEAEDGIHGPVYGFNKGDAIIFLNDGVQDRQYAEAMVKFSKNELGVGYMFGPKPVDDKDLCFEVKSENFKELEFSPAVQIIAYEMAVINDIPVLDMAHRVPHSSGSYFQTHQG